MNANLAETAEGTMQSPPNVTSGSVFKGRKDLIELESRE